MGEWIFQIRGQSLVRESVLVDLTPSCQDPYQVVGDLCVKCSQGYSYNNTPGTCTLCPVGQYQNEVGQRSCKSCQTGSTTKTRGSQSVSDCLPSCRAGRYYSSSSLGCQDCQIGYYQPARGKFSCIACDPGLITYGTGSTLKSQCIHPSSTTSAVTDTETPAPSIYKSMTTAEIAAVVIGCLIVIVLVLFIRLCCLRNRCRLRNRFCDLCPFYIKTHRIWKTCFLMIVWCTLCLWLVVLHEAMSPRGLDQMYSIPRLFSNYGQSSADKVLYVKIFSSSGNFLQRTAIRNTWKKFDGSWRLEFIIENPINKEHELENDIFGDIKHPELNKTFGLFNTVINFFETSSFGSWLLVTKDTTFVNIPQVMKTISNEKAPFISGILPFNSNHVFLISYEMPICVLSHFSSFQKADSFDLLSSKCHIEPKKLDIHHEDSTGKFTNEYHAKINTKYAEMGTIYGSLYRDSRNKMFLNKACDLQWCPFKAPKFENNNTGWYYTKAVTEAHHVPFDEGFAKALVDSIKEGSVVDIGAGVGQLGSYLQHVTSKIKWIGFDGGNNIQDICGQHFPMKSDPNYVVQPVCWIDAASPFTLNKTFDFVLSIEVGEHIAKKDESVFIDNLIGLSKRYIILSWAVVNQRGRNHINCQNNDYIINEMKKRNFTYDKNQSMKFRKSVLHLSYLKKTIMVFEKK